MVYSNDERFPPQPCAADGCPFLIQAEVGKLKHDYRKHSVHQAYAQKIKKLSECISSEETTSPHLPFV